MIRVISELLYGYVILNDKSINSLDVCDCGLIILKENPSSCYRWKYTISDNNIIKLSSKIELYVNTTNPYGRKKIVLFMFEPVIKGVCNISFRKYKSWENPSYYIEDTNYFICIQ